MCCVACEGAVHEPCSAESISRPPWHTRRVGDQNRPTSGQEGAAAVETALVLPLVMMLVFGMLWGGILLFRSITLSDTAREATRYAATLPVDSTTSAWLDAVVQRAIDSANDELNASHTDRSICVALIGTDASDGMWKDGTQSSGTCFNDGRPADEARVQVVVSRQGDFNAIFWSRTVTLTGRAVARYEVAS